jgi:GT2 family glycosyltransferase
VSTEIVDIDLSDEQDTAALAESVSRRLVVLRYAGTAVGQVVLGGSANTSSIHRQLSDSAGWPLWRAWLDAGLSKRPAPPTPAPPTTIAVCTRDRAADLRRCLTSIGQLPDDGQEVLVVDSASRDDSIAEVVAGHSGARYVRADRPGLDIARNVALHEARNELVAFVDDDAEVEADWLREIVRPLESARTLVSTGLVLPRELSSEAQEWFERRFGLGRGFESRDFDSSLCDPLEAYRVGVGASMAMRRTDLLREVGGFDDGLDVGTPTYASGDNDLFARVLAAGFVVAYRPRALAWHRHGTEMAGLMRKFFGYRASWTAFLAIRLLRERRGGAFVQWLHELEYLLARLVRGGSRGDRAERALFVLAELAGWAWGGVALARSRRRAPAPEATTDGPPRRAGTDSVDTESADAEQQRREVDESRVVDLDLADGLEAARRTLDRHEAAAAVVRLRDEPVGVLSAPAAGRLGGEELESALGDELALPFLDAVARCGRPPADMPPLPLGVEALRSWFRRLWIRDAPVERRWAIAWALAVEDERLRLRERWCEDRDRQHQRLEQRVEAARRSVAEQADRLRTLTGEPDRQMLPGAAGREATDSGR